ncbi:MAG: response regulator [Elusimicrobiota bacterium]
MTNKILIIDDEAALVFPLAKLLENNGYEVDTADNGKSGIYKAIAGDPGLIILDVMMDGMNGWEVCSTLRSHPKTKDVKIIMLTCNDSDADFARSKEIRADWFIIKPYENSYILTVISKLLKNPLA